MLNKLFLLRKRFVTFAKGVTLTDLLQILSKLFLMSNRLVTFAEEAVNTAQVVSHEKEICYFCYCYRTDLLQMLSNLFLMRKSYCYRTDLLQMLNNLFLMRKSYCYKFVHKC